MLKSHIFNSDELFKETSNNEEVIFNIPPVICEELEWKEGDVIIITVKDGTIILKKKENKDPSTEIRFPTKENK